MTSFLVVLNAVAATALSALAWPVLAAIRAFRRSRRPLLPWARRVVVLGFDGFSPRVVRELLADGELPWMGSLAAAGTLTELATTCPGISPVAWSSFQTGVNPGKHGIFDFLAADRTRYAPVLSSVSTERTPKGKVVARLLRRSVPFWAQLARFGLRSTVLRVPITYPPEPLDGFLLSGMCVPDLRGTQGSYTLFGQRQGSRPGGMEVPLTATAGGRWEARIPGPQGFPSPGDVLLKLSGNGGRWRLRVGRTNVGLRPGRLTGWVRLAVPSGPSRTARGIAKFILRADRHEPRLYMTAMHPDPEKPPVPLSHPLLYSRYLAGLAGPYATLGLAEDTWALIDGAIDGGEFLEMSWSIFAERRRMLADALSRNRSGLVVCVFDTPDRIQHMFWREGRGSGSPIREMYRRFDALVGEVLGRLRRGDMLLVVSDHGFTSFEHCLDLNRFLADSGFLALEPGVDVVDDSFRGVDWSRTRAYSLGLAGIFLNLAGRESSGIVQPSEAEQVLDGIEKALLGLRSGDGSAVVRAVHRAARIYSGPYLGAGPDLVVGTSEGFRASWNCATGGVGKESLYRNEKKWSGDHCCDSSLVPGILLSNMKLPDGAAITDISATALVALGVEPPGHLDGRSLLEARRRHG